MSMNTAEENFGELLDRAEARMRARLPPVRSLSREEVARLYPGRAISSDFGQAKASNPRREWHPWGRMTKEPKPASADGISDALPAQSPTENDEKGAA